VWAERFLAHLLPLYIRERWFLILLGSSSISSTCNLAAPQPSELLVSSLAAKPKFSGETPLGTSCSAWVPFFCRTHAPPFSFCSEAYCLRRPAPLLTVGDLLFGEVLASASRETFAALLRLVLPDLIFSSSFCSSQAR
jgi:hypothetical protein